MMVRTLIESMPKLLGSQAIPRFVEGPELIIMYLLVVAFRRENAAGRQASQALDVCDQNYSLAASLAIHTATWSYWGSGKNCNYSVWQVSKS